MEYELHFNGTSTLVHHESQSAIRIAPDVSSDTPLAFNALVASPLELRESFAVFNALVTRPLRNSLNNRHLFDTWVANYYANYYRAQTSNEAAMPANPDAVRERQQLFKQQRQVLLPFRRAETRYLKYLFQESLRRELLSSPYLSLYPDSLVFETYTMDRQYYVQLSLGLEMFNQIKVSECGTAQIAYSEGIAESIDQIRDYRPTQFIISAQARDQATLGSSPLSTQKISSPRDWYRDFARLQAAMTLPMMRVDLSAMDFYNLCFYIDAARHVSGANALAFECTPGQPVSIIIEGHNKRVLRTSATHPASKPILIRHWSREVLLELTRLVPICSKVSIFLSHSGWPVFYLLDLPRTQLTLALSGWQRDEYSRFGIHDLLAPVKDVDDLNLIRVIKSLKESGVDSVENLASTLHIAPEQVTQVLRDNVRSAQVLYDLDKKTYRYRPIFFGDIDINQLRFANEVEARARYLVDRKRVQIDSDEQQSGGRYLAGTVNDKSIDYQPSLLLNVNDELTEMSCFCQTMRSHKQHAHPCAHVLALRMASALEFVESSKITGAAVSL